MCGFIFHPPNAILVRLTCPTELPTAKYSPVHDAVRFGELRTFWRVLLELHFRSVRVFAPKLPRLIAAQFLWRHRHSAFDQRVAHRINVIHFQTKVMDALTADFRRRIGFENFDELARTDFKIKSEQLAVFVKIKMALQSKRSTIKIQTPVQIL